MNGLVEELKRRNVLKVAAMYIVTGWLIVQVLDAVIPMLLLPDWVARAILLLLIVGFPVALLLAWAFELTPEGIKREEEVDRSQSITVQTGRKIDFLIIGLLVAAVGYLVFDKFVLRPESGTEVAKQGGDKSIAVLPFVDMSPQQDQEYFSDGISEELLNVLIRVEGLKVASRTSSFAYKDTDQKIPEIAAELEVDHILEGSVRKAGQRVRITAQLIDVSDDRHLWSDTYDRDLVDIFAVQDEIANAIVEALKVALGGEASAITTASTGSARAYNEYLQGRYFWNRRTVADFDTAIGHYERAIELDPNYARAWSALAETLVLMPEYGGPGSKEIAPKATLAIEKALALDPESAEAYTARAYLRERFERRWHDAEEDYRKALELNPKYATAWQWYAEFEQQTGTSGDFGVAKARKAFELDPRSPVINLVLANSLKQADHHEEALEQFRVALSLLPGLFSAWFNMGDTYLLMGRPDDALSAYERGVADVLESRGNLGRWKLGIYAVFIAGLTDPAQRETAVTHIETMAVESSDGMLTKARMLAMLGAVEPALDSLEAAYDAGEIYVAEVVQDPQWDLVRDHPRFLAIVEKLNMMEYLP